MTVQLHTKSQWRRVTDLERGTETQRRGQEHVEGSGVPSHVRRQQPAICRALFWFPPPVDGAAALGVCSDSIAIRSASVFASPLAADLFRCTSALIGLEWTRGGTSWLRFKALGPAAPLRPRVQRHSQL
jgi:hypothetical protein